MPFELIQRFLAQLRAESSLTEKPFGIRHLKMATAKTPPAISKRDFKALGVALVRLINESPQAVYASDLHRMIEDLTGFDVPMHQFMHRLLKLAHQGTILSQREAQPPYRQLFMPSDTRLEQEQIEASSQPLSDVERLRVIREIELSLERRLVDG